MNHVIDIHNKLTEITQEVESTYSKLTKELSEVDLAISDIKHKIELDDFTHISQGYKLAKLLKEYLIKRREIKDQLTLIQAIQSKIPNDITLKGVKQKHDARLNDRTYTYRVLKNL